MKMRGERGNVRWIVPSVSRIILDLATCINSQDKEGSSTGTYSNPAAMEIAAQGIFSHMNNISAVIGEQGIKELSFCMLNHVVEVTEELYEDQETIKRHLSHAQAPLSQHLVTLSLMLVIIYYCSDQVLTTKERRQAKSREAAARSARNCTTTSKMEICERYWQHDLKIGSKKVGTDAAIISGPLGLSTSEKLSAAAKGKKKEPSNLTKMMPQLEENPESIEGFNLVTGDKNLKTKPPKGKKLRGHTQIFRYAYGQIEKEKAMQEQNKDRTFSGAITMATDIEIRTRLQRSCFQGFNPYMEREKQIFDVMSFLRFRLAADLSKPEKVDKRGISGGQRKRINVGLEMVAKPSLLILDEPTSGLDSSSSQLLLRALSKGGCRRSKRLYGGSSTEVNA
ncbi:ABC transporter-like, ATP-binding domain [Dillenia turbinata]|uniref:ABC transporter-like, ATP-binding domain n=1 Tax=Dillenia turbinata TaxID=194707 RepID=A0AAN8VU00_9MAGN